MTAKKHALTAPPFWTDSSKQKLLKQELSSQTFLNHDVLKRTQSWAQSSPWRRERLQTECFGSFPSAYSSSASDYLGCWCSVSSLRNCAYPTTAHLTATNTNYHVNFLTATQITCIACGTFYTTPLNNFAPVARGSITVELIKTSAYFTIRLQQFWITIWIRIWFQNVCFITFIFTQLHVSNAFITTWSYSSWRIHNSVKEKQCLQSSKKSLLNRLYRYRRSNQQIRTHPVDSLIHDQY